MVFPVRRFKDLKKYEFNVEVVTPLFMSGANQSSAELRAQSLKSILRFWWRTLYGSDDIETMKKREAKIFGNADYKSEVKIGLHDLDNCQHVRDNLPREQLIPVEGKKFKISIIEYLAYGPFNPQTKQYRPYYPPETKFRLRFDYPFYMEDQLFNTLKMLCLFNGLGSCSRNGFGSIKINKFNDQLPEDELKGDKAIARKKFTSFSIDTKLFIFSEHNSWNEALWDIGNIYRNSKLLLERRHQDNRRKLIASPIDVHNGNPVNDRHAKPYFLHVHKMPDGKFRGQILFMPYRYHDASQLENYNRACADMNKSIRKTDNFVKEISASGEAI